MFTYETAVARGREAQRVSTAYYRFMEIAGGAAGEASIRSEVVGGMERLTLALPTAEAAREFERFVARFAVSAPTGLAPARSWREPA